MEKIRGWMMVTSRLVANTDTVFTTGDALRSRGWKAAELLGPYDLVVEVGADSFQGILSKVKELARFDVVASVTTYISVESSDIRRSRGPISHILIDARPRQVEEIWQQLQKLPQITRVDITLGAVDISAVTDALFEELGDLLTQVRGIPGVLRTVTLLPLERSMR